MQPNPKQICEAGGATVAYMEIKLLQASDGRGCGLECGLGCGRGLGGLFGAVRGSTRPACSTATPLATPAPSAAVTAAVSAVVPTLGPCMVLLASSLTSQRLAPVGAFLPQACL